MAGGGDRPVESASRFGGSAALIQCWPVSQQGQAQHGGLHSRRTGLTRSGPMSAALIPHISCSSSIIFPGSVASVAGSTPATPQGERCRTSLSAPPCAGPSSRARCSLPGPVAFIKKSALGPISHKFIVFYCLYSHPSLVSRHLQYLITWAKSSALRIFVFVPSSRTKS